MNDLAPGSSKSRPAWHGWRPVTPIAAFGLAMGVFIFVQPNEIQAEFFVGVPNVELQKERKYGHRA